MAAKETLAFIGGTGKTCLAMISKLAQENLRLLFVGNDKEQLEILSRQLEKEEKAEIDVIDCAREGCWEADIIAFTDPGNITDPMVKRIREVATQKIVLCMITEKDVLDDLCMDRLGRLLPNSKVVGVVINSTQMHSEIFGIDPEALSTISRIYEKAGYAVTSFRKEKQ